MYASSALETGITHDEPVFNEAWALNAAADGIDTASWKTSEEQARIIHALFVAVQHSDVPAVSRWQDEQNEKHCGLYVTGFPGLEPDDAIHAFDFTLQSSGCSLYFKLKGRLGTVALKPETFSRMSLVQLPTNSQR